MLASCSDQDNSKAAAVTSVKEIEITKKFECSSSNQDLTCVSQACSYAGGQFLSDLKQCHCGYGKNFIVRNGQPSCISQTIKNDCLKIPNGFSIAASDEEKFSICNNFQLANQNEDFLSNMYMDFQNATQEEKNNFSKWADLKFGKEFKYSFWYSPIPFGDYLIVGGVIDNVLTKNGILQPYNIPDEFIDYINIPISPKYFSNSDELIQYLTNNTQKTSLDNFSPEFLKKHPAIEKAISIYSTASLDLEYNIDTRYKEGCLRSCIARSEIISQDNYSAWFEKFYLHGQLYRSEFRVANSIGQILTSLVLADYSVTLILELEKTDTGILKNSTVFDKFGNKLFVKKGLDTYKLNLEHEDVFRTKVDTDLKIGLCEDGISRDSFKEIGIENSIITGPNKNSFYGWSAVNKLDDYWEGRFNLNAFGLPELGGNSQHANQTAGVLVSNTIDDMSVGVIPLGISSCIFPERFSNFWDNFKKSGSRVINLSASEEMDSESCNKKLNKHPIIQEPLETLWVVAAGNQGHSNPRGCPQHLVGLPNLIIVGANVDKHMHPKSNFGEDVVDIVAPGELPNGEGWGTSFATPRVSRLAALLFKKYPNLTPAQVKKSILLGADIPSTPLPVLSKGILNEENAKEIAGAISRSENLPDKLKSLFCKWRFGSCSDFKIKMQINEKMDQNKSTK